MQPISAGSSRPGSGSSTPNANPSEQYYDTYRPLAAQVRRPLAAFLPPSTLQPSLPTLLDIGPNAYATRLANKQLILSSNPPADASGSGSGSGAGPSGTGSVSLVKGNKRNKGDEAARERARREVEDAQKERKRLGVVGGRKARRLNGGVVRAGMRIAYNSILPLHHLHCIYLANLLSLPPYPYPYPQSNPYSQHQDGGDITSEPGTLTAPLPLPLPPLTTSPEGLQSKLSKADFTGAHLRIVCARNPSLESLKGIVIEETASTFRLVGEDNTSRVIPKNGTLFELTFPAFAPPAPAPPPETSDIEIDGPHSRTAQSGTPTTPAYTTTLHPYSPDLLAHYLSTTPRISLNLLGTSFGFRSADRAGRKFRPTQGGGGGCGWGEEWVKGEWAEVMDLLGESAGGVRDDKGVSGGGSGRGGPRGSTTGAGAGAGASAPKVRKTGKVQKGAKAGESEVKDGGINGGRSNNRSRTDVGAEAGKPSPAVGQISGRTAKIVEVEAGAGAGAGKGVPKTKSSILDSSSSGIPLLGSTPIVGGSSGKKRRKSTARRKDPPTFGNFL